MPPHPPFIVTLRRAIATFNARHPNNPTPAQEDSSKNFLFRITVNYLRHIHPDYTPEERGKHGYTRQYIEKNRAIYEQIVEMYPMLRFECEKQLGEKIKKHQENPIMKAIEKQLSKGAGA